MICILTNEQTKKNTQIDGICHGQNKIYDICSHKDYSIYYLRMAPLWSIYSNTPDRSSSTFLASVWGMISRVKYLVIQFGCTGTQHIQSVRKRTHAPILVHRPNPTCRTCWIIAHIKLHIHVSMIKPSHTLW